MGHRHSSDEILAGAVEVAFDEGLSRLSFGRVATRLGTNDRTVVYYFPSKDHLISAVLLAVGQRLQTTLAPTLVSEATNHIELARVAWPVLARADADRVFALFFEANGLAASGHDPYRTIVPQLVTGWLDWVAEHIVGDPEHRRGEAEAVIALLDGLLLLRQLGGADAADRAARRLGVIATDPS